MRIAAGADRFGEERSLGISSLAFKVCPPDSRGLLIVEHTFHTRGGPARHLHYAQDEWFYALEGEFLFECVVEGENAREVAYHFVMAHEYETAEHKSEKWTH